LLLYVVVGDGGVGGVGGCGLSRGSGGGDS